MKKLWEKWKKITERVGHFQARVLFSALFFILFTPTGTICSFFKDFLSRGLPFWEKTDYRVRNLQEMKEQ